MQKGGEAALAEGRGIFQGTPAPDLLHFQISGQLLSVLFHKSDLGTVSEFTSLAENEGVCPESENLKSKEVSLLLGARCST